MFLTRGARARGAMARGRRVVPFPASALLVLAAAVACAASRPSGRFAPGGAGTPQRRVYAARPHRQCSRFPAAPVDRGADGRPLRFTTWRPARLRPEPFLSVSSLVSTGGERGLLSVRFHPDFAANGRFFVNYTDRAGHTQIVEYRTGPDRFAADPQSARPLLQIDQPAANHNGGTMVFGPDGTSTSAPATAAGRRSVGQRPKPQHLAGQAPAHRRRQRHPLRDPARQPLRRAPQRPAGDLGPGPAQPVEVFL